MNESSRTSEARLSVELSDVIVKPLVSEKTANLAGANQYVFVVRKDANRVQVRSAVKAMYGVSPLSVNILNVRGKIVRFGRRSGSRSDWKKAIVTLPKGQTINVYEGV
ncbi:50S ribosomal protein L23 [Patescibacteria group bacterium]|nr:MAG: 50S ribosomal protein L23 [Patescibacteria group bacterium]